MSGIALCIYVFGAGVVHGLASVLINWAILHLAPAHAGVLTWVFNFPHLATWCEATCNSIWAAAPWGGMPLLDYAL
jgi:hypothetical protein